MKGLILSSFYASKKPLITYLIIHANGHVIISRSR